MRGRRLLLFLFGGTLATPLPVDSVLRFGRVRTGFDGGQVTL